jgi:hypothetical protein
MNERALFSKTHDTSASPRIGISSSTSFQYVRSKYEQRPLVIFSSHFLDRQMAIELTKRDKFDMPPATVCSTREISKDPLVLSACVVDHS